MRSSPKEWKEIVYLYHTSADDVEDASAKVTENVTVAHPCDICNVSFSSVKALMQHDRIKHKRVSRLSRCIGDISKCPVCGTEFQNRIALISHLSDLRVRSKVRGTTCAAIFTEAGAPLLPDDVIVALNERDKVVRRDAAKAGHSHVLIRKPAVPERTKCTAGISPSLLAQVQPHGLRRRLTAKTPEVIAKLKFRQGLCIG